MNLGIPSCRGGRGCPCHNRDHLKVRTLADELRALRRPRDPFAAPGCSSGPNLLKAPPRLTFATVEARLKWTTQPFKLNPETGEVVSAEEMGWRDYKGWLAFKNCDEWLRWRRQQLGFDKKPKARREAAAIKATDTRRYARRLGLRFVKRPKRAATGGDRSSAARKAWETRRAKWKAA